MTAGLRGLPTCPFPGYIPSYGPASRCHCPQMPPPRKGWGADFPEGLEAPGGAEPSTVRTAARSGHRTPPSGMSSILLCRGDFLVVFSLKSWTMANLADSLAESFRLFSASFSPQKLCSFLSLDHFSLRPQPRTTPGQPGAGAEAQPPSRALEAAAEAARTLHTIGCSVCLRPTGWGFSVSSQRPSHLSHPSLVDARVMGRTKATEYLIMGVWRTSRARRRVP